MLTKVKEYFEEQYEDTKKAIEIGYKWSTPKKLVESAVSDCCAVAMFAQKLGISFDEIDAEYSEIRKRLESLVA